MRAVGDIGKSAASQLDSWRRTCVEEELWLEVDDGINDQSLYQIFYLEYIHLRCSAEIINLTIGILVDSPTRRVGESFFDYEYLREYEAQIGTARNLV